MSIVKTTGLAGVVLAASTTFAAAACYFEIDNGGYTSRDFVTSGLHEISECAQAGIADGGHAGFDGIIRKNGNPLVFDCRGRRTYVTRQPAPQSC